MSVLPFHELLLTINPLFSSPLLLVEDTALEDFKEMPDESKAKNAVIVGLTPSKFSYEPMNEAFRY